MRTRYLIFIVLLALIIMSNESKKDVSLKNGAAIILKAADSDSTPGKGKKDLEYEELKRLMLAIPSSFSSTDSANLIANWKLGMRFYKTNCAKCHGIFGKGQDSIPNFSKEQWDDYKTTFLAGDKLNHAVMSKMTEEELNAVYIFVTNIKR